MRRLTSDSAATMEAKGVFSLVSRESALVANNLLLAVSAFVVFVGTIWPLVIEPLAQSYGWRHTYLGIAIFCLAAMLPLLLALHGGGGHAASLLPQARQATAHARAVTIASLQQASFGHFAQ